MSHLKGGYVACCLRFQVDYSLKEQEEGKHAMKLVIRCLRRCVPYSFISEESLLHGQEDALCTAVGSLFLSWLHLRPAKGSAFCETLEQIDHFLEAKTIRIFHHQYAYLIYLMYMFSKD